MSDPISRDTSAAAAAGRPMDADERDSVQKTSAPAMAVAGALVGATAALVTPLGPLAAGVGAIIGAFGGAAVGAAGGAATAGSYTGDDDAHYEAVWRGAGAAGSYEAARPAYQLGHLAAAHGPYVGRDFDAVEPELGQVWASDFAERHGTWETMRPYVRTAYGRARSEGHGVRRGTGAVGSGGSAVDPVELERARAGLPSRDDEQGTTPRHPTELASTTRLAGDAAAPSDGDEITPDEAHHDRLAR